MMRNEEMDQLVVDPLDVGQQQRRVYVQQNEYLKAGCDHQQMMMSPERVDAFEPQQKLRDSNARSYSDVMMERAGEGAEGDHPQN